MKEQFDICKLPIHGEVLTSIHQRVKELSGTQFLVTMDDDRVTSLFQELLSSNEANDINFYTDSNGCVFTFNDGIICSVIGLDSVNPLRKKKLSEGYMYILPHVFKH